MNLFHRVDYSLSVPTFVDPYVWDPADALALIRRVYHDWPIGGIVLWTGNRDTEVGKALILDGRKRVVCLYAAIRGSLPSALLAGAAGTVATEFNVETEEFRIGHVSDSDEDPLWVSLSEACNDGASRHLSKLWARSGRHRMEFHLERLRKLSRIATREIAVEEIGVGLSEDEATAFYRLTHSRTTGTISWTRSPMFLAPSRPYPAAQTMQ